MLKIIIVVIIKEISIVFFAKNSIDELIKKKTIVINLNKRSIIINTIYFILF